MLTIFSEKNHDARTSISEQEKQEAHGPHRSPEKTVQINKHIWLYHNVDKEKKKNIINFMRI